MSQVTGVDITNRSITFYGPYPCDQCGKVVIIRGSVSQGYGDIRLVYPNEPIYPNHNWEAHECGSAEHENGCDCEMCTFEERAAGNNRPHPRKGDQHDI